VVTTRVEQRWVDLDGRGREVIDVGGDQRDRDDTLDRAGSYEIGFLPPRTAVRLPDRTGTVLATFAREADIGAGIAPSMALADLLSYTGLPRAARAGALRALARLGFEPAPGATPGPNLWRVEGSGPDGSTMQVDLDLRTGEVTTLTLLSGDDFDRLTDIETSLRSDTRDS
jgi:hypothetical protein